MRSHETIPVLLMARELGWGGGIERDVSKFARAVGVLSQNTCRPLS